MAFDPGHSDIRISITSLDVTTFGDDGGRFTSGAAKANCTYYHSRELQTEMYLYLTPAEQQLAQQIYDSVERRFLAMMAEKISG